MRIFFFLLFFSQIASAQGWLLHDISVLFPMPPSPVDANSLIGSSVGPLGRLLPLSLAQRLPQLEPSLKRETQLQNLEVVGVRIDPPEIRLVWGVYGRSTGRSLSALDTAVHTFHRMSNERSFMLSLKKISLLTRRDVTLQMPLSVHPTLYRQGLSGEYGQALKQLLLSNIGERNLFKVTFMTVSAANLKWDFGGFIFTNGAYAPLQIPRVNTNRVQVFINDAFPENFAGGMGPAPQGQDTFLRLLSDSQKSQVSEPSNLTEAHGMASRLENPQFENAATADCVSCHLAGPVRQWTEKQNPRLQQSFQNRYVTQAFSLQNFYSRYFRTDNLRAFGWFGETPSINQRTINETAYVATRLNSLY